MQPLLKIIASPFIALLVLMDKLSGNEKWCRRTAGAMQSRKPYSQAEVQNDLELTAIDLTRWCLIRTVVSQQIGVQDNYIYPTDSLESLMRLQFPLPDLQQIVFAIEARFNAPLNEESIRNQLATHASPCFNDFVSAVVNELDSQRETGG